MKLLFKKSNELAITPSRGSDFAAGYDLCSTEQYILGPLERKLFKTGISIAIPSGLYGRVAPRSGLALKNGIDVMAGVIDEDYRGDVGVILINLGDTNKPIEIGDKIAQIIFENYTAVTMTEATDLPASVRGQGGFGSSDKKEVIGTLVPKQEIPVNSAKVSLEELYHKVGGIPIKPRYSEEMKQRQE